MSKNQSVKNSKQSKKQQKNKKVVVEDEPEVEQVVVEQPKVEQPVIQEIDYIHEEDMAEEDTHGFEEQKKPMKRVNHGKHKQSEEKQKKTLFKDAVEVQYVSTTVQPIEKTKKGKQSKVQQPVQPQVSEEVQEEKKEVKKLFDLDDLLEAWTQTGMDTKYPEVDELLQCLDSEEFAFTRFAVPEWVELTEIGKPIVTKMVLSAIVNSLGFKISKMRVKVDGTWSGIQVGNQIHPISKKSMEHIDEIKQLLIKFKRCSETFGAMHSKNTFCNNGSQCENANCKRKHPPQCHHFKQDGKCERHEKKQCKYIHW